MFVNSLLIGRETLQTRSPSLLTITALLVLASVAFAGIGAFRRKVLLDPAHAAGAPDAAMMVFALLAAWLACAAGILSFLS
jgi:hypothetical protein